LKDNYGNFILILFRNAELWSANLDELPPSYVPPEKDQTWGLGWFKR
jgi:hypothetical protein